MSKRKSGRSIGLIAMFLLVCGSCGDYGNYPLFNSQGHALVSVTSCNEARAYIAEMFTEQLLGGNYWGIRDGMVFDENTDAAAPQYPAPSDYTTTNVQEEGVDEADIVETDGEHVYVVHESDLIIARSWPPENTAEVGRVALGGHALSMFLHGDRVAVFSQSANDVFADEYRHSGTRVTLVDVSDRANPQILRQVDLEGWMVDARAIEGQVYLVMNAYLNAYRYDLHSLKVGIDVDWRNAPNPKLARLRAKYQLLPRVMDFVADLPLSDILPKKIEHNQRTPLLRCSDLYRPGRVVQPGIATVVSLDMHAATDPISATGVLGGGMEVYASLDNIYLAQSSWAWMWGDEQEVETHVHKLSFDSRGDAPAYQASGRVSGWMLNQFSMSEHAGFLRVATTDSTWWDDSGGNNVFVLKHSGRELNVVGELVGLSPGEQIFAARFLGDRAYLVTFLQIDPLHAIDLSNPYKPRELGQLEIPGFSTYLHPLDEGFLLAIGEDGDWNVQLSLFDVRDPHNPTRLHQHSIGVGDWGSHSEALYDHHAFTYHPERRILAIPINIYKQGEYFTGAQVFRVSTQSGFELLGSVDHSDIARAADCPQWYSNEKGRCYDEYRWWVQMRRSVFIEDFLYTFSSVGLSVNELTSPSIQLTSLVF